MTMQKHRSLVKARMEAPSLIGSPCASITYYRKNAPDIVLNIGAGANKYDIMKIEISPSYSVNPPAVSYIDGVKEEYSFLFFSCKEQDDRIRDISTELKYTLCVTNQNNSKLPPLATTDEVNRIIKFIPTVLKRIDKSFKQVIK